MTTVRGGYLNRFETDLNKLQDNKTSFQVVSSGLTRKLYLIKKMIKVKDYILVIKKVIYFPEFIW